MVEITEEIQEALSQPFGSVVFEEAADETYSPLNEPVKEKDIARIEQEAHLDIEEEQEESSDESFENDDNTEPFRYDAPEQVINEDYSEESAGELPKENFELPTAAAKQMADTFLGIADNLMQVGGGFFVKIKKHRDFYEFDEIVQVIEEQNKRNVKRLTLDEEDKVLLRPLLVALVKKKSTKLTPEQQLLGAALSILMKKGQAVMEMRMENDLLVERIQDIIREEKGIQSENDQSAKDNDEPDSEVEIDDAITPDIEVLDNIDMMEGINEN